MKCQDGNRGKFNLLGLVALLAILFYFAPIHFNEQNLNFGVSVAESAEPAAEASTDVAASPYGPAPKTTLASYPTIKGINGRVVIWLVAQLHLWFAAFVLAVPIFVFIIEAIGMRTRDRRYDNMAYEFIKVSITAYSLTAILGGLLLFSLVLFYPDLWGYLATIFKDSMFWYAALFFAESACLYLYYYGWHWLQGGFKKWVHLTLGLMLNAVGTTLMLLANAWLTFMM
ncbi:MAG: hypothetical protein HOG95_10940, partial [Rhodospirillaceae bacterium]|nr:hypothetical protein [Rhodospirillaceae bacterium]